MTNPVIQTSHLLITDVPHSKIGISVLGDIGGEERTGNGTRGIRVSQVEIDNMTSRVGFISGSIAPFTDGGTFVSYFDY
jgi:hypothetical protein